MNYALDLVAGAERGGEKGFVLQRYIPNEGRTLRVVVIGSQFYSYWRIQDDRDVFCSSLQLQSMINRNLAIRMSGNAIKNLKEADAEELFDQVHLRLTAKSSISVIRFLTEKILIIEKEALCLLKPHHGFQCLQTIPGIGDILALTIMLEVGDIDRFPAVGNYSSYCRCVKSERISNGKKKGKGNQKNGNKYLSWAYVEAANFAMRFCPYAKKFYQRKKAKTNGVVGIKALSNKLARASYYIIRDEVAYDPKKLLGIIFSKGEVFFLLTSPLMGDPNLCAYLGKLFRPRSLGIKHSFVQPFCSQAEGLQLCIYQLRKRGTVALNCKKRQVFNIHQDFSEPLVCRVCGQFPFTIHHRV
jgi:hypothetical protein